MEQLQCLNFQFNIFFEPVRDIREKASTIENYLKDEIPNGFNILPNMGDNVPLEIPRMVGNDSTGKYGVVISCVHANIIQTKFENSDVMENFREFQKVLEKLYISICNIMDKPSIKFCGITMILSRSNVDGVNFIREKFINSNLNMNLFDIYTKFTYLEDEKYYVNIALSNLRNKSLEDGGMGLQIDVNDRYRYNISKDTKNNIDEKACCSEDNVIEKLSIICEDVIKNRIQEF